MTSTPPLFFNKIIVLDSGCWEWQGNLSVKGYGRIGLRGKLYKAHRICYELFYGKIPKGNDIHHICKNKRCCNPRHLENMTHSDHSITDNHYSNQSQCKHGHEYNEKNTIIYRGGRVCLICSKKNNDYWRNK